MCVWGGGAYVRGMHMRGGAHARGMHMQGRQGREGAKLDE